MLQYWEKFMWDKISQMFLLGSLSGIAVLGDVIREYLLVNLIVLFVFVDMGIILLRMLSLIHISSSDPSSKRGLTNTMRVVTI